MTMPTFEEQLRRQLASLFETRNAEIISSQGGSTDTSPGYVILQIGNVGFLIARDPDGVIIISAFLKSQPSVRWPIDHVLWAVSGLTDVPPRLANRSLSDWSAILLDNYDAINDAFSAEQYSITLANLARVAKAQHEKLHRTRNP